MTAKRTKELGSPGLTDEDGNSGSPTLIADPPSLGSAPSAKEAEEATKKTTAAVPPPEEPRRQLTSVPLRVFAQVSGLKADQFRPFAAYATREEMRACPVPEWHARLATFQSKPTPQLKRLQR